MTLAILCSACVVLGYVIGKFSLWRVSVEKWLRGRLNRMNRKVREKRRGEDENPQIQLRSKLRRQQRTEIKRYLEFREQYGYAVADLVSWIESNFDEGMSWDNYGDWELDHAVELCRFDLTNPQEYKDAAHYKNCRPLWRSENRASRNIRKA